MGKRIDDYIGRLSSCLKPYLSPKEAEQLADEVKAHLLDSASDIAERLDVREVAEDRAAEKFGNAKSIAWQLIKQSRHKNYWVFGRWLMVFSCYPLLTLLGMPGLVSSICIVLLYVSVILAIKASRQTKKAFLLPLGAYVATVLLMLLSAWLFRNRQWQYGATISFGLHIATYVVFLLGATWATMRSQASIWKCVVLPGLACSAVSVAIQVAAALPVFPQMTMREVHARNTERVYLEIDYLKYRMQKPYFPNNGDKGWLARFEDSYEDHRTAEGRSVRMQSPKLIWDIASKDQVLFWTKERAPKQLKLLQDAWANMKAKNYPNVLLADQASRKEILDTALATKIDQVKMWVLVPYLLSLATLVLTRSAYRLRTLGSKPISQ